MVLRPGKSGIISHTMYFTSEVRADEEYRADTKAVSQKELDLAQTLIHSLAAPVRAGKVSRHLSRESGSHAGQQGAG